MFIIIISIISLRKCIKILKRHIQTGEQTTAAVLSFGLLFLVRYPEVQKMVQEEIASVLGTNCPTLGHRKRMPYTQV